MIDYVLMLRSQILVPRKERTMMDAKTARELRAQARTEICEALSKLTGVCKTIVTSEALGTIAQQIGRLKAIDEMELASTVQAERVAFESLLILGDEPAEMLHGDRRGAVPDAVAEWAGKVSTKGTDVEMPDETLEAWAVAAELPAYESRDSRERRLCNGDINPETGIIPDLEELCGF